MIPNGPLYHFYAPGSRWSSQIVYLGVPVPSKKLSWKSPREMTLDPGRLAVHGQHCSLRNTHLEAMLGGTTVWSQTSDSALWPQPFTFLKQESDHSLPSAHCRGLAQALQVVSSKPLTCILEALEAHLMRLEAREKHKGWKFSNLQPLSVSTIYSHKWMRGHGSNPILGYSSISSWNSGSIQAWNSAKTERNCSHTHILPNRRGRYKVVGNWQVCFRLPTDFLGLSMEGLRCSEKMRVRDSWPCAEARLLGGMSLLSPIA